MILYVYWLYAMIGISVVAIVESMYQYFKSFKEK
jgi:hypothetical protein